MTTEDDISPAYVRARKIDLELAAGTGAPKANQSIVILVDYSQALPEGISLPLVLEVQGPSPSSYQRRIFDRTRPASFVVTPREGGAFYVGLRELAHNKWWGAVRFNVAGEQLQVRGQ